MLLATLILLLSAALFILLLATRPRGASSSPPSTGNEAQWERKVLSQTLGNRGAMERAVTAKRRKHPRASRAELLEMVYQEYVRDRA